ncbi:MAG TPA: hypothetical protein VKW08_09410 [Xanthobacteraceae bacterium]|nr:hypothetical protein [Xanthobacteraceae bacterium]
MRAKKALIVPAATVIFAALVTSSLAGGGDRDRYDRGGYVVPCSLAGVNPAYHPEIFGNPVTARDYGFIRAPDGGWQVAPGCGASGSVAADSAYGPRAENPRAARRSRR